MPPVETGIESRQKDTFISGTAKKNEWAADSGVCLTSDDSVTVSSLPMAAKSWAGLNPACLGEDLGSDSAYDADEDGFFFSRFSQLSCVKDVASRKSWSRCLRSHAGREAEPLAAFHPGLAGGAAARFIFHSPMSSDSALGGGLIAKRATGSLLPPTSLFGGERLCSGV